MACLVGPEHPHADPDIAPGWECHKNKSRNPRTPEMAPINAAHRKEFETGLRSAGAYANQILWPREPLVLYIVLVGSVFRSTAVWWKFQRKNVQSRGGKLDAGTCG